MLIKQNNKIKENLMATLVIVKRCGTQQMSEYK